MKSIRILMYWAILLVAILSLAISCVYDKLGEGGENSSKIVLEVDLCTPANHSDTRALLLTDEYLIKDIALLLFDENDKLIAVPQASQLTITSPGDVRRVTMALDKDEYANKTVQVMFLANLTDNNINIASLDLTAGRTKQALLKDLQYTIDGNWPSTTETKRTFPMYGIIESQLNGNDIHKSVYMLRAVARIQIYVNQGKGLVYDDEGTEKDLFKMSSVHVFYSRKGGYAAPLVDFNNEMTSVTLPSSVETFEQRDIDNPLAYTVDATKEKYAYLRSIYIPENDNVSLAEAEEPVIVVVGGYYRGELKPTYYRVDFEESGEVYDVLRNYTYDFNITDVTQSGADTPEDALKKTSEIQFEIKAWSEVIIGNTDLSAYELKVSKSTVISEYLPSTKEVTVTATYYTGEWKIDEESIKDSWFHVSKNAAGELVIEFDRNGSDAIRTGSFTITSGQLTKRIYVSQLVENTANCYVVSEQGLHGLKATVMGNGGYGTDVEGTNLASFLTSSAGGVYNSDGTINKSVIASAALIWQSRPGLITSVGGDTQNGEPLLTEDDILPYMVGEPLGSGELGGNAVIGILDSNKNIIWSWHIWVVWGWVPENNLLHFQTTGVRSGYYVMDKNLGAFNNEVADARAYGLLYEWGRKDPMRGAANYGSNDLYPTYGFTGAELNYYADNSNLWHSHTTAFTDILTSVRNPMDYSTKWGAGVGSSSPALWGNPNGTTALGGKKAADPYKVYNEGKKSIYDPCPPNYKVPSVNGFYFGTSGEHAICVHEYNGKKCDAEGYCDIIANGYYIYYFGKYTGYEKYHTWMPMAPYYAGTTALTSAGDGEEFAFTWLNAGTGGNSDSAEPVGWHPQNNHIHKYADFPQPKNYGGTVRCVKETDPDRIMYTVPEKIVLQNKAGSSFDFEVLSNIDWKIEDNDLTYDWISTSMTDEGMIRVTAKTDNPGVADRIGYVVISFANGEKAWVKIIQNGFPFSAGSIILNRATAGITGSTTFTLPSGCSATVVPGSYPAWFTPSVSVNGGTGTLTVTSTSANLGDQRTATVDVMINSNPNYTYTITVTQPATGVSFFGDTSIDVNKAVGGKGDNITISKNVPSGISWEIISKPDFISVSPVSGVTDGKNDMKLTVAVTEANTSGSARTGEVIFRFTAPDGSTYDKIVTVTQSK